MISYEYEPGGAVKKATYPAGTVVENTAGSGGVVDNVKVGDSSSTAMVYQRLSSAANGAPEAVRYIEGPGTVNGGRLYDPTTLWLKELKVGPGVDPGTVLDNSLVMFGLSYDYEKNGNVTAMNRVWRQTAGADSSWLNGSYTYDKLNRLKTYQFTDTRLGMTVNSYRYLMDEYGNLLAEQRLNGVNPAPGGMSVTVDAGTNRLAGKPHDTLGNLLRIDGPGGAPLELSYRDQGHVAEVKDVRTGLVTTRYYYDADGKSRVKERLSPAGIVTGVSYAFYEGEYLVCERDTGELIQPEESYTRKFLLTDHLGTTRAELTFNASSNPVIARVHDTMPYGEPIIPDPQSSESVLFTGKQRDAESGLDCFGARFYSNNQGRWGSPDLPFVGKTVENPLSWNLYSYVLLNPIGNFDPNGLFAASFHRQLVIDALATLDMKQGEERILFGRTTPMSDAAYNADIDFTKTQHFDNMQSLNEIFDNYANMEQEVCYGFWEVKCGSALHAMQDFYCHTNYIGLYLMVHPDAKPGEIPTLSQAMASKDQAFKNLLFSGMLFGGLWGLFSEKNVTALGHDNVEITSTSTLGNKLSPAGYHLYEYAEALAFQETCIQLARRKFKGNRYATFDVIVTGDLGSLQVTRPSR